MTGSILRRASARMLVAGLVATSSTSLFACGDGGSGGQAERVPTMVGRAPATQEHRSGGRAPEIEDLTWSPREPVPGRAIQAEASVSDPDGDRTTVDYQWLSADGRRIGEGRRFRTSGLEAGDTIELVAIASDGENESEPWSVEIELGEQAAAIDLVAIDAPDGARPGAILEAVVEATDESQPFEILYTWRVGNEVVGEYDALDTSDIAPGLPIVLSARLEFDDRVTRPVHSRPFTLSGGGSPRIASEPPSTLERGVFRYQIRVADAAADVRYVLAEGPDGMTVDARRGVVVWRPGRDQRGRFDIEVQALDRWGSGAAQTFSIVVDDPAPPASAR